MALTPTIIINGLFSLSLVIFYVIIGLSILLKYKKRKDKFYILTGISWIGISEPWWPSSISFLIALFNDTGLPTLAYLVINNNFLPIFLMIWLIVVVNLISLKRKALYLTIYGIIAVVLEIFVIFFLLTDISLVGIKLSPVDIDFGIVTVIFLIFNLLVFIITGIVFALKTYKIGDPVSKLRGIFLLLAILLYLIGAILEIVVTLPVNRLVIFLSALTFYIGFTMPERVKKIFIK